MDETMTNDDEEMIDHKLLKKIAPDTISNGSQEFKKMTSRRFSGQQNKSVDVVFKERLQQWKKN